MQTTPANPWFFPVMVLALCVWGGLLALGAFLGPEFWSPPEAKQPVSAVQGQDTTDAPPALVRPFDWRKPIVVAVFVAIFLSGWALALWARQTRLQRQAMAAAAQAEAERAAVPSARP
jgi:hypothetical protein